MAGRLLKTADTKHDHHQREVDSLPCVVVVFGVKTPLQRRAAAKCKRHSQRMPSRRFLGRDPPVVFLQATEGYHHGYVPSARVKSTYHI